eukprot:6640320-Pyramimonas_sp.AAC.1
MTGWSDCLTGWSNCVTGRAALAGRCGCWDDCLTAWSDCVTGSAALAGRCSCWNDCLTGCSNCLTVQVLAAILTQWQQEGLERFVLTMQRDESDMNICQHTVAAAYVCNHMLCSWWSDQSHGPLLVVRPITRSALGGPTNQAVRVAGNSE